MDFVAHKFKPDWPWRTNRCIASYVTVCVTWEADKKPSQLLNLVLECSLPL